MTARKREETITDVPIAITAISGEEIQNAGFENILDIAKATPGFVFESYNSLPGRYESVPFIRGVVFDNNDPTRQTVSVFVDGIYVSGGTQGIGVEDVQRIEVIKGPQSALFGRATFAGAVNYVTLDPSDEFQGEVSALVATRGEYEVTAAMEGPIASSDVFSGRLSARYSVNDGHYPNDLQPSQQLGEENTWSIGGTLLIEPSDAFRLKLRGFYSKIDDNHPAVALYDSTLNSGPFGGVETIFVGVLPERNNVALNVTDADFQTFIERARAQGVTFIGGEPDEFGLERDSLRLSLDANYAFSDYFSVSAIIGVNSDEGTILQDADFSPDNEFTIYAGRDFEDLTAEFRFAGSAIDDRLDWAIGYSYYDLEYNTNGAFGVPVFDQASSFGNLGQITLNEITTSAVYGQLNFAFNDRFKASLEVRSQDDEIDEKVRGDASTSVAGAPSEFSSTLPRLTLDFKPTSDSLLYVSYSEGNLPGGFNGTFLGLSPAQQAEAQQEFPGLGGTYDEEKLENFEIGWKQTFAKGSIGLAIYNMDRTDQVTTAVARTTNPDFGMPNEPEFVTTTVRVNTAASEIDGIEFEGTWFPSENLSMRATVAYTDAKISGFPAGGDSGDYEDVFGTDEGFIGNTAERYPPWQMTFSSTYEMPMNLWNQDGDFYVRGDIFYADKYFLSTPNLGEAPAATEVNVRAGFRNDAYTFEAFITNLFEETAPITANNGPDLSAATSLFTFGVEATNVGLRDKRQFGIRLSRRF
ncbi:MAG: TonB-dependent receptor [Woeseiaceae bacterium]|nr:TonB-dependent receptor [Woeseiaceae bacterium]